MNKYAKAKKQAVETAVHWTAFERVRRNVATGDDWSGGCRELTADARRPLPDELTKRCRFRTIALASKIDRLPYVGFRVTIMTDDKRTTTADGITATYSETETERRLEFTTDGSTGGRSTAAIAQNREGYAMLKVRPTADGDELERYYGFDMALDHVAELLGTAPHELPVPETATDMGM